MKASEVFANARKLLEPGTWTQGELARNVDGDMVPDDDVGAVCWCLEGACKKSAAVRGQGQAPGRERDVEDKAGP